MLVYGKNVAFDLLKKNKIINKIYFQDNFDDEKIISLVKKLKISFKYCTKSEMSHLCNGLHQGIILDIPDYSYSKIDDIFFNNADLVVILDHLEDPHNLGAIIRTCEAAGIKYVIIPKNRQVLINSTVMKTSVGTLDNVNIVLVNNISQTIRDLKNNNFWIVGTSLDTNDDYRSIDYSGKIALVIGNEGDGISKLVSNNCDYLVKIPMYGQTNRLNASVAAGIMIYEIIRNRK